MFCKFLAFKSFSRSLEQFFLTVGQNNFGNKIPIFLRNYWQNFIHIISYQKDPNWRDYLVSTHDYNLKLYRGEWIVLVVSGHALFLSPLLWCHHCTTFWQENRPFPAKSVHCMYLCIALRGLLIKLFSFTIESFEFLSRTILVITYTIDTVFFVPNLLQILFN